MAFIGVAIAVSIISSLCAAVIFLAYQENLMGRDLELALKALYAAEGGIRVVFLSIQNNPSITFQEIETICENLTELKPKIGDTEIERVIAEDAGDAVKLTATGISGSAKKIIVAYVSRGSDSAAPQLIIWREKYDIY